MEKITFVTQSSRLADDAGFDSSRLINVYPEAGPQNGKGPVLLRSVLGREAFAATNTPIVRAMEFFNNKLYVVSGGTLFSISEGGNVDNLDVVGDSVTTTISSNGDYVTVAANGVYSVWDGTSMTTPSGGRISSVGTVAHLDHYTILTERNGDELEWTTLADPTTRDALFFATNESKNDKTLRVLSDRLYLWFFGVNSIEVWYNTGLSDANAFSRISGGALETGLLAANLATKTEAGLFFIGDDKVAYVSAGAALSPVSTPAVNEAINAETPTHCFYYEDRGHRFCVIRFANRPSWIYDISTGLWAERSTGVANGPWDVVAAVHAWGNYYCATIDGTVYKMSRTNTDITDPLRRVMVSSSLYLSGAQFSVSEAEFLGNFGESTNDTTIMFRISRDGGRVYGPLMTRSAGKTGERELRTVLRALGRYRNFSIEVSITDATDINIYSQANVRIG